MSRIDVSQIQISYNTNAGLLCVTTRVWALCSLKDCEPRVRLANQLFTTFSAGDNGILVYTLQQYHFMKDLRSIKHMYDGYCLDWT